MEWIEPVSVKSAVKYTSSLVDGADQERQNIIHGSITESNIAWFASGDRLDVVSTTHCGVQSRHFSCQQGQDFSITCVAPIPNETLALVGLSSDTGSGAVALYNYVTSMILNSWSVSHKVTCVCSMEIPNASYRQFLKSDCFLFALGTEEGHVMLLAVDQHFKFSAGTHQLDLNIVHYVTTDDILQKRVFFKPPVVLVIPLNDSMYRAGRFVLESMHESNAVLSVRQEEVSATVVKYIPQNQTLCVGYNTQGAFQMFSLKSLELDFSGFATGCNGEKLDQILDFVFLEPEDDPRHFCYLSVVAQKSWDSHAAPYALLYSLTYVRKEAIPDGGILYEDLQYITLRLDLNFGPLIVGDQSNGEDVELLRCQSLASSNGNTRATGCYGLCYFAMSWKNGIYLAIFDLNQWYQAQMPPRWIFDDTSRVCPFLGFYQSQSVGRNRSVQQVWIQPATLSVFHRSSTTPAEAFFYPSALSFRAMVVCPQEAESVMFLGMQSLLLQKLSQAGSQVLNHPHRFYVQAMKAGLTHTEIIAPHAAQMAESLLNVGLENNSRSFLISCIKDEGANLNFVEKWAWQQVVNLKSLRENLCNILFDHSCQEMERQMYSQLYHVTHQFNNLSVLYDVMDKRIRSLNSGINDKLRDKSRAIYLLSLHLETVLWFLHGGLLPEIDEDSVDDVEGCSSLPYPRRQLEQFYRNRKSEIESLSSSVKAAEVLLIDQLVPASVVELWAEEKGTTNQRDIQTYPPPSLYALLSAYLRPDVDDVTKHRLVQYVFMDLTWIYGRHAHYGNILQHLVTFPSTYSLKPSMIKVTQAFWHLDHQNFDDALGMLLDPLVHTMDITNAQQRAILRAFLYQDKHKHALKYATLRRPVCPELEDIQLHLTILIANGLISDALSYIRRNRNQRNSVELMQHLLNGCQEMRKVSVLLTLPLSEEEEDHVTNFLKQSRNIDLQEALLLFYIQRCKYPDAIAYSQRLNQMWPARDTISRERFNRREMLMQTLIGALPPITCKLAAIANSRPPTSSTSSGGLKFPRPLSVSVLPATSKIQSSGSNFFRTVIEQSRATWLIEQKLHEEVQTPLRPRKRKLDDPEAVLYPDENQPETTPFLCNIVQPAQRNITLGMSLCFPSPRGAPDSMDITSVTEQDADASQSRQGKRPRFSLFPKAIAAMKTDAEVVSVLQTPPIRRSRPCHPSITEADGSISSRPSSILKDKMRRFMNFSAFETAGRPASEADPSESETEMEVSTASAKQLRFRLPQPQDAASPPLDISEIAAVCSVQEDDDMEVVTDAQHSNQHSLVVGEDSQFLSFEDDSESAFVSEVAQVEEKQVQEELPGPLPVEKVIPDEEISCCGMELTNIDLPVEKVMSSEEISSCGMELTNIESTTTHPIIVSESALPDDDVEEAPTLAVLERVVEKEQPTLVIPGVQQSQNMDESSNDESDIVCLDSSSDEAEGVDSKSVEKEEEEELEGDYDEVEEEEEPEEEELEEEEEDHGVAQEEIEEVKDDIEVIEEEEEIKEDDQVLDEEEVEDEDQVVEEEEENEVKPIVSRPVEEESEVESEKSVEEDDKPQVSAVPDVQVEPISEPVEDEAETKVPEQVSQTTETGERTVDILQEESFVPTIDYDEEDEVSEYSQSMEGSVDEQEDLQTKKENLEDSSSSSETHQSLVRSAVGHQTTISTSIYKQRFTMSSSSSSSEEEANDSEDNLQLQEAAALRKPRVSGYSEIEPDFESVFDVTEAVAVQPEPTQMEEEDSQQSPAEASGYSQIEPDMDDGETVEDEPKELDVQPIEETSPDPIDSPHSPVAADVGSEDEEGCEKVDEHEAEEEEEDFELKLTETPKAISTVRPSCLRRFSMSSLAGSEGVSEEDEVIEPEMSPTAESQNVHFKDVEEEEQPKPNAQRSSVFKSRLHLTDSEASSDGQDDVEAPAAETERTSSSVEEVVEPERKVETDEGGIEAEHSDESNHTEGSTTDENVELRNILEAHEKFEVPFIPDAAVITSQVDLSTIVEERSMDQSTMLVKTGKSPSLDDVGEEEEDQEKETEDEGNTEMDDKAGDTSVDLDNVVAAKEHDEAEKGNTLEPPSSSDDDTVELELPRPVQQKGRSKSLIMGSHVPLPFTSRRSVWETREDRDRSPESITSEPPQKYEDMIESNIKRRTRRHSSSTSSTSQVVTRRRSSRLSTSVMEGPTTPVKEEVLPSTLPTTPPKASRRRSEAKGDQPSAPPSCEVSPAESSYSGRSSVTGTPIRRSARISALRDRTPEPTASTDALLASLVGRIRRHSSGPGGPDLLPASPLRRSGRKSSNVSRDNSPTNSVTSEPPPVSTSRELTPSRRKHTPAKSLLRSGQKSVALNLFPLEEEKETEFALPFELQPKMQSGSSYQDLSVAPVDSDESISLDEISLQGDSTSGVKKQKKPLSRPSSVASGRYNLRRAGAGRTSELDIISEEAAAAAETVASNMKRGREDASEESSDQAGPSQPTEEGEDEEENQESNESSQKTIQTKRVVRNKRRKKAEEVEVTEELRFAPASRPPPKSLPKRDPVIKSRTSVRRSMRLDK
ncbi:protein ELYS-like isoform X2 [Daphnia carinata]|uniref:protein ELYS-like isoform X1 n=1 Tax=Daphnia carinata TaxID=120202 RepID=UPI00257A8B54|nr:protein ELYS-like isoform X1 [Daphnia carinata]XP_059352441.1 protein ELYS-like isoform X2 [Daphnia carinata]XP_059352442.1 protein ELYS-like isoform X2 [Daphnia carinata]